MPLGRLYHKVTCREKTEKAADQKREEICNDLLAKLQTEGSDLEPESGQNTGIIGIKRSKRKKSGQKLQGNGHRSKCTPPYSKIGDGMELVKSMGEEILKIDI